MTKRCLIVIDLLNDFLDTMEAERRARLIRNTNELIGAFRGAGFPIIWVRQAFKADLSDAFAEMREKCVSITIEGTRGAQIHDDLDRQARDRVIVKKRYSAFFGTNLDITLKEIGSDELVLSGVNTHACIRMAAIDAYQRDLKVILATDCIDSYDEEHARVSLAYMAGKIAHPMTNAEIEATLRTP
ncbi:MAG: isochorismatase family cysteine hydrolase [Parvibaculum sp.]|uniref:cysteine hydrolase family protein n=1 Tax=Parvibaculum sp. TaxID=2024848 RepID=UPI003C7473BA